MASTVHEDMLAPGVISQLQFILDRLFKDGQRWIKGIGVTDWRRLRYAEVRARRSSNTGPSITHVIRQVQPVLCYVAKPASEETGSFHGYVIVKGDNSCLKESGIALIRPVLKLNFDHEPTLNFHVWFHCMPSGNDDDHLMVGWRLEGPEGGGDSSPHDFFHAQPLRSFGPEDKGHGLHDRFPIRFPTIPLPASNVVELCLTAVLVACGKETLRTFIRSSGNAEVRAAANSFWTKVFGKSAPSPVPPGPFE
jgi:hypothetical protein